jgi:inorganic pyrophosphatase
MWDSDKIKRMISIVTVYIHIRKGVNIKIEVRNGGDLLLLKRAYEDASAYMQWSNIKINKI